MKNGFSFRNFFYPIIIITIIFIGCGGPKKEPQTPTAGYITVKGSEEVLPMMMEQAYAFMDLYAKAKVLVLDGGSDRALAAIFTDSAQVAFTTRPISTAELERSKQAGFKVNEYKICKDGIAIVVNPKNPIKKLSVEQVIDIFTGKLKNWADGSPIRVCIWDDNSGTFEYFKDSILKGKEYLKRAWRFATTEDIIKHINQEKSAIGMISMSRLYQNWSPLVEETRIKAFDDLPGSLWRSAGQGQQEIVRPGRARELAPVRHGQRGVAGSGCGGQGGAGVVGEKLGQITPP